MDQGQGMMGRVVEEDRLAVGETEQKGDAGGGGHKPVRVGDDGSCLGTGDGHHAVAVDLVGRRDLGSGDTQVGVDARVVLGDGVWFIADGAADVERVKGLAADASEAGEYGVDQALCGQALKVIG
jgi:hypothetical protein